MQQDLFRGSISPSLKQVQNHLKGNSAVQVDHLIFSQHLHRAKLVGVTALALGSYPHLHLRNYVKPNPVKMSQEHRK